MNSDLSVISFNSLATVPSTEGIVRAAVQEALAEVCGGETVDAEFVEEIIPVSTVLRRGGSSAARRYEEAASERPLRPGTLLAFTA